MGILGLVVRGGGEAFLLKDRFSDSYETRGNTKKGKPREDRRGCHENPRARKKNSETKTHIAGRHAAEKSHRAQWGQSRSHREAWEGGWRRERSRKGASAARHSGLPDQLDRLQQFSLFLSGGKNERLRSKKGGGGVPKGGLVSKKISLFQVPLRVVGICSTSKRVHSRGEKESV